MFNTIYKEHVYINNVINIYVVYHKCINVCKTIMFNTIYKEHVYINNVINIYELYFCLFINVVHKCVELVIKHQFFNNKMVSTFHNIHVSNYG